eukprot:6209209-Pleurochrysis_carterae.AAC.1
MRRASRCSATQRAAPPRPALTESAPAAPATTDTARARRAQLRHRTNAACVYTSSPPACEALAQQSLLPLRLPLRPRHHPRVFLSFGTALLAQERRLARVEQVVERIGLVVGRDGVAQLLGPHRRVEEGLEQEGVHAAEVLESRKREQIGGQLAGSQCEGRRRAQPRRLGQNLLQQAATRLVSKDVEDLVPYRCARVTRPCIAAVRLCGLHLLLCPEAIVGLGQQSHLQRHRGSAENRSRAPASRMRAMAAEAPLEVRAADECNAQQQRDT